MPFSLIAIDITSYNCHHSGDQRVSRGVPARRLQDLGNRGIINTPAQPLYGQYVGFILLVSSKAS